MSRQDEFKNAWHNVRGVTSEELERAAAEAERLYGDIINLARPVSTKHPPLSMEQKAAQFSPFAALTGYEDAIDETGRLTQQRIEQDEDQKARLDVIMQQIQSRLETRPQATFTYFLPDLLKEGGQYVTRTGSVRKIDRNLGKVILTDGEEIMLDDIYDIHM